jgi:hypothetical protein
MDLVHYELGRVGQPGHLQNCPLCFVLMGAGLLGPRVVILGVRRPFGGRTGRAGGQAALSITPYMNRAGYCRQRNYCSKFTLL